MASKYCYVSNPDVAGIGIRASIYTQSFLLFFTTFLCIADGVIDSRERKALEKTYLNLLIPAFALLVAASIEAATSHLDLYHAILVLELSVILTINAFALFILPFIAVDNNPYALLTTFWKSWRLQSGIRRLPTLFFFSVHLSLMGSFGVYVWSDPARLTRTTTITSPDPASCVQNTVVYFFSSRHHASSHAFRIISLVWFSLMATPILNIIFLVTAAVVVVTPFNVWRPSLRTVGRLTRVIWILQTAINVQLVIDIELSVLTNKRLIYSSESAWGLGQIITIILTINPVIDGFSLAIHKLDIRTKGKLKYWFRRRLTENEERWPSFHDRMCKQIDVVATELQAFPDLQARDAILHALTGAVGFLHVANATITRSPVDIPLPPSNPNSARSSQIEMAAIPPNWSAASGSRLREEIDGMSEEISRIRNLRLLEVNDVTSFLVVRRYLRAARSALGTAQTALDAPSMLRGRLP